MLQYRQSRRNSLNKNSIESNANLYVLRVIIAIVTFRLNVDPINSEFW